MVISSAFHSGGISSLLSKLIEGEMGEKEQRREERGEVERTR